MSYIDRLIANCELAKKANPVNEFEFNDLSELADIQQAIYVIEQIDSDIDIDIDKVFLDFSRYKNKKERKCAKLNSPSKTMYVGSSTTGVQKRIKQHQGLSSADTYALHLTHWFKGEFKITIKQYDVDRDVLQIIEDDLSEQLKPAFGKQGGNGK